MRFEFTAGDVIEFAAGLAGLFAGLRPRLLVAATAYAACLRELSAREPEFGGLLLGPAGHPAVTHFVPDLTGAAAPSSFTVGAARLNEILRQYVPLGLEGKGFAHSHPSGFDRLSPADLRYAAKLLANPRNDAAEVLMPVVCDGRFLPFVVRRGRRRAVSAELVVF